MHSSQQFGCDGTLSLGGWVGIGEGFKEGAGGRTQLGRARDVQGARLQIVPKRRSQVACGFAQSACDHWPFTLSLNCSRSFFPLRGTKAGNKGPDEKLLSVWG